jgi:capsular exopolysaccharide synthesis family protein
MELSDLGRLVVRRRALIAATVALVGAMAVAASLVMAPRYTAPVTLRLATASSLTGDAVRSDSVDFAERLQNTYASIARSGRVREALAKDLKLDEVPEVSVELKPGSELMTLLVTTGKEATAVQSANRLAELLVAEVRDLETGRLAGLDQSYAERASQLEAEVVSIQNEIDAILAGGQTGSAFQFRLEELRSNLGAKRSALLEQRREFELARLSFVERLNSLSIVEQARDVQDPGPGLPINLALGLGVGLVAGIGLAAAHENVASRITRERIEGVVGAPLLGEVAAGRKTWALADGPDGDAEVYRRVRTELLALTQRLGIRTVLVTSAEPHSAAPAVAANIATTLARAGHHVVVVDADVDHPVLHELFETLNRSGLAEALIDDAPIDHAPIATTVSRLKLLPAGVASAAARDAVTPPRVGKLVAALEERYELVVVASPSPLESANALAFAREIPGVLLVVSPNRTRRSALNRLRKQLETAGSRVIGVVAVGVTRGSG